MESRENIMQEMYEEGSESIKKEIPIQLDKSAKEKPDVFDELEKEQKIRMVNGLYAIEVDGDLPPLEHMKFLDEAGQFKDEKPPAVEDLAYYWRKQQRKLGIILGFSGIGLGLIILSATDKYANAAFQFMSDAFWFVINFILGLFPAGLLPF